MHTQNTLHISDSMYAHAKKIISIAPPVVSDDVLVYMLVTDGLFEYQAQKMVEQRETYKQQAIAA